MLSSKMRSMKYGILIIIISNNQMSNINERSSIDHDKIWNEME